MGRRWGKSTMGGAISLACANAGAKVAWVVPTYRNGRPLWRWAERTVAPLKRAGVRINRTDRIVEFPSGGFLSIYSADNATSILGESFHLVIVDEAARIDEAVWTETLMPTLADHDGRAILISTPRGMNWFYTEWMKGQQPNGSVKSWNAPSAANPSANIQKAAQLAKGRIPDRTYRQEWLAEFVQDGQIFRFVDARATAHEQQQAIPGHMYIMGCDWGKTEDYTVLTIVDMTTRELVLLDRFNTVDYTVQIGRLQALYDRFTPIVIMAEQNSIGTPIIEQLWRLDLPVQPFVTSNTTKARIIEDLLLAFEQNTIGILDDPILKSELKSYAVKKTPSGLPLYSAPAGMHDDTVMSLAVAWSAVQGQEYMK
jgi:hypothetical protein